MQDDQNISCVERELTYWLVLIQWTPLGMDSLCGMSYTWFLSVLCSKILYGWAWMDVKQFGSQWYFKLYFCEMNFFISYIIF